MDDDVPEIGRVAEQLIAWWGGDKAYAYAREQADIARGIGDRESAITWRDIARAIIKIRSVRADLRFWSAYGLERAI
jgi:hypothetical protein